jgi:hypothetical protein
VDKRPSKVAEVAAKLLRRQRSVGFGTTNHQVGGMFGDLSGALAIIDGYFCDWLHDLDPLTSSYDRT